MEEIDLKELFEVFWNKKIIILLVTLIFVFVGLIYSLTMVEPKYKTATTLLLAQTNASDNASASITTTEVTLNQKLVSTYSGLIKSDRIIRKVLKNLNMSMDEEELRKSVSVNAKEDTEIIQITVTGENPDTIVRITNEMAKVFIETIEEFYHIENVYVVDEAKLPEEPYNINHLKDIAIFAFIGFALSCAYVLVANMLDTTIKDADTIERQIGLPVLVSIPEYEEMKKGGKK